MENHLKRVLNLVKRTGDTMVVVDKDGDDSFVVMDLDKYEAFLDFEDGSFEDFNEDFEDFDEKEHEFSEKEPEIWDVLKSAGGEEETWDLNQLDNEEIENFEKQYKEFTKRHVQEAIDDTSKKQASEPETEEKTTNKTDSDEFGEEQFYLEPVE